MEETKGANGGKMSQFIIDFLIHNIPIFDSLSEEEIKIIEKYLTFSEVFPGEIVIKEGDSGDHICFVVDGSLDVLKKSGTGESIAISTLSKGRSIGEMAVIDDLPRSATVKARTKATLVTLSRENFNHILEEHSRIGVKILKGIARLVSLNLRKTSNRLLEYMLPLS